MDDLIKKMKSLKFLMQDISLDMQYYAGFDDVLNKHAIELSGGADMLQTWIDGIENKEDDNV